MKDDVIVIGAGQAGLCASYYLTKAGIQHAVLEAGRVGEAWRSQRWDSFCLVTPNWTVQLPGMTTSGDPDGFMPCQEFVEFIETFAQSFSAPVERATKVTAIRSGTNGARFDLDTTRGPRQCDSPVVCCGMYQTVRRPEPAAGLPTDVNQIDAVQYRNPHDLDAGAVLVVGSGQSGAQIAEEIHETGRRVYLSVGRAGRIPRKYRGRDLSRWQVDMGYLDRTPAMLDSPADRFRGDPHVSGLHGGHTLNLHQFARNGIQLLGSVAGAAGDTIWVADNLTANMKFADEYASEFCRSVDNFIHENGIDAPLPDDEEFGFWRRYWRLPGFAAPTRPAGVWGEDRNLGHRVWI